MRITPGSGILEARVEGIDLAHPLADADFRTLLRGLGEHGVLCFPGQDLTAADLASFGARFGTLEVHVANTYHATGHPEVMILSNVIENGRPIGLADAGQGWHTDMSYNSEIALANVLYAQRVPRREGRVLGNTEFRNMHLAYDELPDAIKRRIEGMNAIHDFEKFWDMMRFRPGSGRAQLSPRQRASRPPVAQPIVRTHPITGRKVLYCNPGYAVRIEGTDAAESDELLEFLFRHQAQDRYLHAHEWSEGEVLMWDDIGTTHNAVADYGPDEPRLMLRVQAMATLDYGRLVAEA
jgi:taurine dioxygenase